MKSFRQRRKRAAAGEAGRPEKTVEAGDPVKEKGAGKMLDLVRAYVKEHQMIQPAIPAFHAGSPESGFPPVSIRFAGMFSRISGNPIAEPPSSI